MTADQKALDRIGKLLRLAAPSGGSTEHERASAALEAVRIIDELGVKVTFDSGEAPPPHRNVVRGAWVVSIALDFAGCSSCHGRISRGDAVWIRVVQNRVEYRHNYKPCALE